MDHLHNVLVLAVMCVLAGALAHHNHEDGEGHHKHAHDDHGDWSMVGRQREDSEHTWVTCDFSIDPKMRCHDCNTRLICKRVGGLLFNCPSSFAPYCNNGLCSPVPSVECAKS